MEGVRIFIDPDPSEPHGDAQVFYSRRGDGPLYRWSLAEAPKGWRVKRMNSSELTVRELSQSRWKNVPTRLQKTLTEHYQD